MRRAAEQEPALHENAATAAPTPDAVPASARHFFRLGRWLREPLLHFLLAGFLLFVAYRALNPEDGARLASNRIVITDDDPREMGATWTAQGCPPLTSIGLPKNDVPLALFAFNVGVEVGQLLFIAVVLALLTLAKRVPLPHPVARRALPVASYVIGALAAFWFIERLSGFWT